MTGMLLVVGCFIVFATSAARADSPVESANEPVHSPAPTHSANEIQALEERIERLEAEQRKSAPAEADPIYEGENLGGPRVGVFDALELDLGGFLTQTLTVAHGDRNTEVSPNQTLLEILLRARPTERVSVFAALGWLREADLDLSDPANPNFRGQQNRTPQIISWFNYRHQDALQLRLGRIITPQGIINIEHFPPTLLEINQPQFLRPFPGATIFPNFLNGAEVHGRRRLGDGVFRYSVFGGVFTPAPEDWTAGGRAAWEWIPKGLAFGVNVSGGSRNDGAGALGNFSTVPVASVVANDYAVVGADLLLDHGRIIWKTEVFYSFEEDEQDRLAFYTQPGFRLDDRWTVFYRFDHLDPGQNLPTTLEHVLGLNFLPHRLVRFRLTGFYQDYLNGSDDAIVSQLSLTVSF